MNARAWPLFAVSALLLGGCGGTGGESPSATTVGEQTVASAATTANEPTTAETTSTTQTDPAIEGRVVMAPVSPWMEHSFARIVGQGDDFIRVEVRDGFSKVSRSSDGLRWDATPTALALGSLQVLVADDARLLAAGPDEGTASAFVSSDGGATWTGGVLAGPANEFAEYASSEVYVSDAVISPTAALVVGAVLTSVDWSAYSRGELGADHGEFRSEYFDKGQLTIMFEDGFVLSIDPARLGTSEASWGAPTTIIWRWNGDHWDRTAHPFASPSNVDLVAGPAGFLGATQMPTWNPDGSTSFDAYRTTDGQNWEHLVLPAALAVGGFGTTSFAAGPLGYIAIGREALFFSTDGAEWSEVHRWVDPDPTSAFPVMDAAAGRAGFALPIRGDHPTALVLWSNDGLTWNEINVAADAAQHAFTAVSDRLILVMPVK